MTKAVFDLLRILRCIFKEDYSEIFDNILGKDYNIVSTDSFSAFGFILGDGIIIPRNRYCYIEIKSTLVHTIVAGIMHLKAISDERYLYINCSGSGHSIMNYHLRFKTYDKNIKIVREVKRNKTSLEQKLITPSFLAGYFDADGSVSTNTKTMQHKIVFVSKNPVLLMQISRNVGDKFGINMSSKPTRIRPYIFRDKHGNIFHKRTTYQIYTTNEESTLKFIDLILPHVAHIARKLKIILIKQYYSGDISKNEFNSLIRMVRKLNTFLHASCFTKMGCLTFLRELIQCF